MARAVLAAVLLVGLAMPADAGAQTKPAASGTQTKPANVPPQTKPPTTKTGKEAVDINLGAYVELLRSDVRSQKIAILTQLMELTEAEDKAFWPLYREYDRELSTPSDERVANIQEYAKNYPDVSDAVADKLILKALDIQARRGALLSKLLRADEADAHAQNCGQVRSDRASTAHADRPANSRRHCPSLSNRQGDSDAQGMRADRHRRRARQHFALCRSCAPAVGKGGGGQFRGR